LLALPDWVVRRSSSVMRAMVIGREVNERRRRIKRHKRQ
jgi:hypothetical protein